MNLWGDLSNLLEKWFGKEGNVGRRVKGRVERQIKELGLVGKVGVMERDMEVDLLGLELNLEGRMETGRLEVDWLN